MKNLSLITIFLFKFLPTFSQISPKDTSNVSSIILNEVVVTGPTNAPLLNTPKSLEILRSTTFKANATSLLHNMLNTSAGVYMVDMGNEQHAMSIRLPMNYDALYTYLENDIAIRPAGIFNNNALLEINKFAQQKIEVAKGPFSSGYGAASVGATVNFLTKNYEKTPNELLFQANGYGQWEISGTTKVSIGNTKILLNLAHSQRSVGSAFHFDYRKNMSSLSIEKTFSDRTKLLVYNTAVDYVGDQRDGYDSTTFFQKNWNSFDKFSDRKTFAVRTSAKLSHQYGDHNSFSITAFQRILSEKQNPFYLINHSWSYPQPALDPQANGQITTEKFTSYGLNLNHRLGSLLNGKLRFTQNLLLDLTPQNTYQAQYTKVVRKYGVNESFVATDSLLTNYQTNLVNLAGSLFAAYDLTPSWQVHAGARYDNLAYRFTNYISTKNSSNPPSTQNSFKNLSFDISLLHQLTPEQTVFVQYSNGFTPPTLSKMYRNGTSVPKLTPAKYSNYEIGYKFLRPQFFIQASAYLMNGIDEFVTVFTPSGSIDNLNAGQTEHRGVELSANYSTKTRLEFIYNATFAQHTFVNYKNWGVDFSGKQINSAPRYFHTLQVAYQVSPVFRLIAESQKMGKYFIDAQNSKTYNGHHIFNLKTTFVLRKFSGNVGINNVFDTVYATNADGTWGVRYYPGLGRTFQVGAGWSW